MAAGGILRQIAHLDTAEFPSRGVIKIEILRSGIDAEGQVDNPLFDIHEFRAGRKNNKIFARLYFYIRENKLFPVFGVIRQ